MAKRLNRDQRLGRKVGALRVFVQQYARKAADHDPNDRRYDRSIENAVKQMPPEELDRLLRDDEE
jgi:hypothetical protein